MPTGLKESCMDGQMGEWTGKRNKMAVESMMDKGMEE